MRAILNAVKKQGIPINPVVVISNKPTAGGLRIAKKYGVKTEIVESKGFQGTKTLSRVLFWILYCPYQRVVRSWVCANVSLPLFTVEFQGTRCLWRDKRPVAFRISSVHKQGASPVRAVLVLEWNIVLPCKIIPGIQPESSRRKQLYDQLVCNVWRNLHHFLKFRLCVCPVVGRGFTSW